MANGIKIISEEDFVEASSEKRAGWTHRMLTIIEAKSSTAEAESREAHSAIAVKLDQIFDLHSNCPGRNYRPKLDKAIMVVMSFLGGFIAYVVMVKTKLLATMHAIQ